MEETKKVKLIVGIVTNHIEVDDKVDHIQTCPNCGSQEMVKGEGLDK